MIGLVGQQLLAIVAAFILFGVPGWAISRLLELHLRVPTVLLPVVYFTFGLGLWTISVAIGLSLGWPIGVMLLIHGGVSLVVVVISHVRERRRGHAKLGSDAFSGWTLAAITLSVLCAAAFRTRLAFDALFHLGLVRRLAELHAPTFDTIDRIAGAGVNPAYALPTWQAGMAGVSRMTGLDAATVLEAMAVVAVLLSACAAAALGRVVSGTVAGEVAGAAAYGWLRVFYPRRELEGDGVAYEALPGNLAIDVLLVLVLIVALLLVRRPRGERGNTALGLLGALAIALLVVLHANYVVYLAIIGLGTGLWLFAAGPWSRTIGRRLGATVGSLVLPGALAFAAVLPVLAKLEHFGAPMDTRIDYHLTHLWGIEFIRPGHLYDWFAAPGLLAMLTLPWAAWRARGNARALIAGGSLAIIVVTLTPPLVKLLGSSGSLTMALRLPRPMGVLLIAAAAVAIPDLTARVGRLATRAELHRGRWAGRAVRLAPLVAITVLVALYGYPRARKVPPDYGWNWPTLVALAGLLVVLVLAIRNRSRAGAIDEPPSGSELSARTVGFAAIALAVCMLPSGVTSMRRAAWQAREFVPAYKADDLRCYDGIQRQLRDLPAGSVLLADPILGYGAQALAPVQLAGDFKIWNGTTDRAREMRRIQQLNAVFNSSSTERAGQALARLSIDLNAKYVLVSRGTVVPPVGSKLPDYDAAGLRTLLDSGTIGATRIAQGHGRFHANDDPADIDGCRLELWKLTGSERRLEVVRPAHHRL
jgi:hypothetical protein